MSSSAIDPAVLGGHSLHAAPTRHGPPPVTQRQPASGPHAASEPHAAAATAASTAPTPAAPSDGEDEATKKQAPGRPMGRTFDGTGAYRLYLVPVSASETRTTRPPAAVPAMATRHEH